MNITEHHTSWKTLKRPVPFSSVRFRMILRGLVQGVGFRPFIYKLAKENHLKGWVQNSGQGLTLEVEGRPSSVQKFLFRIEREKPLHSAVQSLEFFELYPAGYTDFAIKESEQGDSRTALILPDIAICKECIAEVMNPRDRRYHYPFTNCTQCGPRYSILLDLPYDRERTTMKGFQMCGLCEEEYENPQGRRFHAQPNACPDCGPSLELWDSSGCKIAGHGQALKEAVHLLKQGAIGAVKGISGFHLMTDAASDAAVEKLRRKKHREEKPFAVLAEWEKALELCEISELEERLLKSPEAPIVLLKSKNKAIGKLISNLAAPRNPWLGIMLPSNPLHYLLLADFRGPLVATSGNLSEEPMVIDEKVARRKLQGIADFFLVHNRPIARPVDDSIVRVVMGRELILRRARGYAPLPMACDPGPSILALGAQMKNTLAQTIGKNIFISQHLGDLGNSESQEVFKNQAAVFSRIYQAPPNFLACDEHPGYASSRWAGKTGIPVIHVQHHYAHVLSCMAENEIVPPALGVAWDGTGQGPDHTVWGGEFLEISDLDYVRFGHFRTFSLPGDEKAVMEPRRSALGILYEIFGDKILDLRQLPLHSLFSREELRVLVTMMQRKISSPRTSSAGRLFDAVASLLGLCQVRRFEGQAAMEVEFMAHDCEIRESYPVWFSEYAEQGARRPVHVFDWEPLMRKILADYEDGLAREVIAAKFHNTLAEVVVHLSRSAGFDKVVLTGGCFQNKRLLETCVTRLREEGFLPYWHQRIPPNDGGIALGQIFAAVREIRKKVPVCA